MKEIVQAVRKKARGLNAPELEVCIDCVAYALHRWMDFTLIIAPFLCTWSHVISRTLTLPDREQVYGHHASVLYTRGFALAHSLSSLAHHFLKVDSKPYKLQPGGPGYEIVYGCTTVPFYLKLLASSSSLADVFDHIAQYEQTLLKPLLRYLRSRASRGVRIVGDEFEGLSQVPTVSFVMACESPMQSRNMVNSMIEGISVLATDISTLTSWSTRCGRNSTDDVVGRISMVHYNIIQDVQNIICVLDQVLALINVLVELGETDIGVQEDSTATFCTTGKACSQRIVPIAQPAGGDCR